MLICVSVIGHPLTLESYCDCIVILVSNISIAVLAIFGFLGYFASMSSFRQLEKKELLTFGGLLLFFQTYEKLALDNGIAY